MVVPAWLLAVALSLSVLAISLAAGEAWLRWFPRSDSIGVARTAQEWLRQCWQTGPDGYRPHPTPRGPARVVVLGDSVAAGYGLCDPAERFGDRLAARLGGASVYVVADNGADTRRELSMLNAFHRRPDVLVLSYVVNDIEGAAAERGLIPPMPPRWPALEHSYLADFVYWRLADLRSFFDVYRRAWADPETKAAHLADLARLFDFGVPVVLVVWPVPSDPETTRTYTAPVVELARERGAEVLDVGELTGDMSAREWMVNGNDAHPSAEVHRRVGAALAGAIQAMTPALSRRLPRPSCVARVQIAPRVGDGGRPAAVTPEPAGEADAACK